MDELKREVHVSVRGLVEFVLRSGDIDNRKAVSAENAMQEGSRIHRMIQKRMGPGYHAEVVLVYRHSLEEYDILIEGRADGILIEERSGGNLIEGRADGILIEERSGGNLVENRADGDITADEGGILILKRDGSTAAPDGAKQLQVTIDEIKGTFHDVKKMKEPVPVHLAQAKCYAYIYAAQNRLDRIRVRMTYCHMETEEIRYFHYEFSFPELEQWFLNVMEQYRKWADYDFAWQEMRQESIKALPFPFEYREGQKELVSDVYRTIYHQRKLFIEAPTGVGKTISTVFPAVKAMGEGMCRKIFYLTAKTITRTVAEDTFRLLREHGLKFKSIILTAKEKICFMEETECDPDHCPYAKGHYDRVNDAMYDLLTHEDAYSREKIEEYAKKHRVCPFEMCLDMSLFSDAVICDYNYVFDPHVYLRRFFAEGVRGDYVFLIDEAHNLVERGRKMYSAVLCKEDFLKLRRQVKDYDERVAWHLNNCNKELLALKRECTDYRVEEDIEAFVRALTRLSAAIDDYLDDQEDSPVRKDVLEFYFEVSHFLEMYDLADEGYVTYSEIESDGSFILKLFCVNPAKNLRACMMRGRSSVLFSATLLPIQYYKTLLGAEDGDYEVYARSIFRPEKMGLYIGRDVTSRYTRRSGDEYYRIAAYIHEVVGKRHGNYMLFFPSHAFLREVYDIYMRCFNADGSVECIVQEDHMNEQAREEFLGRFTGNEDCDLNEMIQMDIEMEDETSLLGFCVMGGIFGEGIDLKKDSLIGAVVVGTGIPQVCSERELLKKYFDSQGDNGFDYAYRYPGMNKVLQAAGRVIRTVDDFGIVVLLDERFLTSAYQRMFPREWRNYEIVDVDRVGQRIERFWNEWL